MNNFQRGVMGWSAAAFAASVVWVPHEFGSVVLYGWLWEAQPIEIWRLLLEWAAIGVVGTALWFNGKA